MMQEFVTAVVCGSTTVIVPAGNLFRQYSKIKFKREFSSVSFIADGLMRDK
jgi:hypothetical protein